MYQRETDVSAADTLDQKTASQSQRVACAVVADDFGSSISSFRRTPQRRHYAVARSRLEAAQFAGSRVVDGAQRVGITERRRGRPSPDRAKRQVCAARVRSRCASWARVHSLAWARASRVMNQFLTPITSASADTTNPNRS